MACQVRCHITVPLDHEEHESMQYLPFGQKEAEKGYIARPA